MKKSLVALVISVVAPLSIAYGATNTGTKTRTYRRASTTSQAKGHVTNNFYYNQSNRKKYGAAPATTAAPVQQYTTVTRNSDYKNDSYGVDSYVAESYQTSTVQKKSDYSERYQKKTTVSQERKYFLAHPFFQPLKGNFGSVTDIAFSKNSFDFDLLNSTVYDLDPSSASYYPNTGVPLTYGTLDLGGKAQTNQFLVKQDFSFGLTDKLAIVAMGQYDSTKLQLKDWTSGDPDNENKDSGVNVFGFGFQLRFIDTPKVIGMTAVNYESQRDTSDSVLADVKLGYKFDRTTLYLVGRGGYSWLKEKDASYGFYVDDDSGDWLMLSYKRGVSDVFYAEGGLGVFSVLSKYFTVNAEAFFGNYDWHNQLSAKAAFGIQPFDSFALNIYASGVLYDSAENKIKEFMNYDLNPAGFATGLAYSIGDYKIKNYNEYKIGAQIILHF